MTDLRPRLLETLTEPATTWFQSALDRIAGEGQKAIPELFPQLPRRIGRDPIAPEILTVGDARVDLGGWRRCDLAAYELLARDGAPDALEVDLFLHGDLEERAMVMRCLGLLPVTTATVQLLGEAQRTNTMTHFEAAICDNNLAVRAMSHAEFSEDDFNRIVLKVAFSDLPLDRMLDASSGANPELSRMLQGLATEREAAGRAVWADTNRLIAHAPAPGTIARLIGHLEHGDDRHRLGAAEGLLHLGRPEHVPYLTERLEREPRESIRAVLAQAIARTQS